MTEPSTGETYELTEPSLTDVDARETPVIQTSAVASPAQLPLHEPDGVPEVESMPSGVEVVLARAEDDDSAPAVLTRSTRVGDNRIDAPRRRSSLALRALGVLVALGAILLGFELRRHVFLHSATIHQHDAATALKWGNRMVLSSASAPDAIPVTAWRPFLGKFFTLYASVKREHPDGNYGLDVPPLRLLAIALWTRGEYAVGHLNASRTTWNASLPLNAPLLLIGTTCELAAATLMFLLVHLWVSRAQTALSPNEQRPGKPWLCGLAAALLLWFNPALLLDSAAWPQFDSWIVPFYLGAILLASLEWWTWAGVCLGVGVMLKAQLLFVAPLLLLWPLMAGKPRAALRALGGFAAAAVVILSPWLLQRGSAWWSVAFAHGLRAEPVMSVDASNLPAVLASRAWNWNLYDLVWTLRIPRWHIDWPVRMKALLIGIYSITLLVSSWGAARKSRRHDVRVLISFIAPWILLFTLLPQMHGRYLVWGATLSAAMAGVSVGMTLMHLLITALAMVMILRPLLATDPSYMPKLAYDLSGLHPNIGWAMLMCALIFLVEALLASEGWRRRTIRVALPIVRESHESQVTGPSPATIPVIVSPPLLLQQQRGPQNLPFPHA